jgi:hypothetical protein
MKNRCIGVVLALIAVAVLGLSPGMVSAKEYELPPLNPADFTAPMDNTYLPMALGDTYVYMAETEDELLRNEITNTFDTKIILGVTCTVVYDVEWIDVEGLGLVKLEETYDWQAWDNFGNVWYFGEYTIEYLYDEAWTLIDTSTEGSWEAGVDGATPGILMLADPMPGLSYPQEYLEDEAEDMGRVLRLNASVSVEYGDFDDCLQTKEWTPLEPGEIENKFYAPDVGLVYIKELKGKTVHVELVDIE